MEIKDLYKLYLKDFLVDTDTRNIRKNSIFFALKGENFNGNTFAEKALELGAKYAVVDEKQETDNKSILLVDDVLETLQKLANYHRRQLNIPFIGLTGSNGKTTTKELINSVLSKKYKTLATKGNLNNHIGVPLTLLSILPEHEIVIIEMGANHQKEIEFLSSICEPDFGYITNFGKAHLEGFGGIEGVIKGKSELYTYLKKNNKIAFINPKDEIQLEKTKDIKSIKFDSKNIKCMDVNPFIKIAFKDEIIQSNLIGKYNFTNIVAALTIGEYFKISDENLKKGIEDYIPENNRSQIIETKTNKIILDAYNANPSSMKVALESFNLLNAKNKVVILGDMFELGNESETEHQSIVDYANTLCIEHQIFVGEHFFKAKTKQQKFKNFENLKNYLETNKVENSTILIKGSRGMRLERALELFS